MRTGASLRAKKSTSLRTGGFFTLSSARGNFDRAEPGQNSANSARIRLGLHSMPIFSPLRRRNLSEAFGLASGRLAGRFFRDREAIAARAAAKVRPPPFPFDLTCGNVLYYT